MSMPVANTHTQIMEFYKMLTRKDVATLSRFLDQGLLDPGGVYVSLATPQNISSHSHGVSSPAARMLCLEDEAV